MLVGTAQSEDETERAIAEARARLEKFEQSASSKELLERLRRSNSMHPFLLVRGLSMFGMAAAFALAVGVMLAGLASRELAQQISIVESASGVPLPFVLALLGALALVTTVASQLAAVSAARSAPLLPHEAKQHQRLLSEVKQLEAQRDVNKRMTPKPAQPRLLAR